MASVNSISVDKSARLIATPNCPGLIDARIEADMAADPRLIPGSMGRPHSELAAWANELDCQPSIVICGDGGKLSPRVA